MLDFLRHCRHFSFHERDFRPSLLCLQKSSLFVLSLLSFPNQMFPSFLSVGSQLLHYTLQGEFFTHPPTPFWCFNIMFHFCVSDMAAQAGQLSSLGESPGTSWDKVEQLRQAVGFLPRTGGGAVPGRHDYSCPRSSGLAVGCVSVSFTSKLTRCWLPPRRLQQWCLRLQPPRLL